MSDPKRCRCECKGTGHGHQANIRHIITKLDELIANPDLIDAEVDRVRCKRTGQQTAAYNEALFAESGGRV
jgi:hypothetical protein